MVTVDRRRVMADLTIVWAGGAATRLTSKFNRTGQHYRAAPEEVLDLVRRLAPHYTNEQIALILNSKRLRTGHGNTFTARRVATLRLRLGIPTPEVPGRFDDDDPSWIDVSAAATELSVSPDTIRRWAREGFLEGRQLMPNAPRRVRVTDDVRRRASRTLLPAGWV